MLFCSCCVWVFCVLPVRLPLYLSLQVPPGINHLVSYCQSVNPLTGPFSPSCAFLSHSLVLLTRSTRLNERTHTNPIHLLPVTYPLPALWHILAFTECFHFPLPVLQLLGPHFRPSLSYLYHVLQSFVLVSKPLLCCSCFLNKYVSSRLPSHKASLLLAIQSIC